MEMKEIEVSVEGFGTVPARTTVEVSIPVAGLKDGDILDAENLDVTYECVDCGYKTQLVDKMLEHQKNQKNYHSLWQRLKRRWCLLVGKKTL